jgi:DNA repair exonuclease SbcCD ATPase subunit
LIPIKLNVRGVTVLKDVSIDFASIPGDIIAITGRNGQGKTSLMESVFASLYRFLPSRSDNIYEYCHGRDCMIEYSFLWHGRQYRSLANIDAIYSKMEAFLYDDTGQPVKGITGKSRDFDSIVSNLFGPANMVLASSFAAQDKSGNFLALAKIERKQLFISMLNLEMLGKISKAAGQKVAELDKRISGELGEKIRLISEIANREDPEIEELRYQREGLRVIAVEAQEKVFKLREEIAVLKESEKRYDEALKRLVERRRKTEELTKKSVGLRLTIEQSNAILKEAVPAIRNAASSLVTLRSRVKELYASISQLTAQKRELSIQKEEHDRTISKMREDWLREQSALKWADNLKKDAEESSKILTEVPCQGEGDFAKCQFLLQGVEKKEKMESYEVDILNHKQAMLRIQDEQKAMPKHNFALIQVIDEKIKSLEGQVHSTEREISGLERLASRTGEIDRAETRILELKKQIEENEISIASMQGYVDEAEKEVVSLRDSASNCVVAIADLALAETNLRESEVSVNMQDKLIAAAELENERIQKARADLEPLQQEMNIAQTDRRQWALLETAFGPNGIQSLEIDASGPTVSSFVNDLLASCFGSRFSLKFITQQMKADQSGFKDEFDAQICDSENGTQGTIGGLSGGEKVICLEAIGLAIAIFNKLKSGISWESLWRDEVSGSLDYQNSIRYIKMLRRARDLGHFQKVYLICHQEHLQSMADAQIRMEGGIPEIFC